MTKEELDSLENLNNTATPGEWKLRKFESPHMGSVDASEFWGTIYATEIVMRAYCGPRNGHAYDNAALVTMLRNNANFLIMCAKEHLSRGNQ
jgi:hypothetical protein